MKIVDINRLAIQELCRNHSVLQLFVFGSALSDRLTPESDIDMIVSFDSIDLKLYADNYFDLKFALEDLFEREVDLLEEQAIRNTNFKASVDKVKHLIYG